MTCSSKLKLWTQRELHCIGLSSIPTTAVSSGCFLVRKNFFAFKPFLISFCSPENGKKRPGKRWGCEGIEMDSWRWIGSYIFTIFFFCSSDGGGGTYEAASIIACWSLNQNISASYRIKDCDIQLESLPVALQVHHRCCLCVKHTVRQWESLLEKRNKREKVIRLLTSAFWFWLKISQALHPCWSDSSPVEISSKHHTTCTQISLLAKWNMTRDRKSCS